MKNHLKPKVNKPQLVSLFSDHSPDKVKFRNNSMTFPSQFAVLLVTHITPVLVLLSVVVVGMQQCMIQNKNKMHKFSKVKNGHKYAANNKHFSPDKIFSLTLPLHFPDFQ